MTKHNLIDRIARMDSDKLRVNAERCLHVRHRNADCLRCTEVCTAGAIVKSEDGLAMEVFPEKCIGCGTCASVCPAGCLEALNPTDTQLEAALLAAVAVGQGRAAMACQAALEQARALTGTDTPAFTADGAPVVGVVCLGRAEEGMLTEAVVKGATALSLIHHDCKTCDHAPGGRLCTDICASMASLLAAFGSAATVTRVEAAQVAWAPAQDGAVFAAVTDDAPQGAGADAEPDADPVFAHVQQDGTLPHAVPVKRLRLFNSLKRLGAPVADTITTRLWGQVTINTELCRSCRMCTVFCPTGAVSRFTGKEGAFGVEHRSALCVQCGLCAAICPEQAITVSSTVSVPEFIQGTKFRFEMQPLGWKPNGADTITSKMVRWFQMPNIQDLEGHLKSYEVRDGHAYARQRDARRAEIRAEAGQDAGETTAE